METNKILLRKMCETKTVHQCLFCPQTFNSAAEKDDHTLEHFAQETCADCNQHLIRIGGNLYTIHNAVTCIKVELKSEVSVESGSHEQNTTNNEIPFKTNSHSSNEDESMQTPYTFVNTICTDEFKIEIKQEPVTENEQPFDCSIENVSIEMLDIPNKQPRNEPLNTESVRKKKIPVKTERLTNVKKGKEASKQKHTVSANSIPKTVKRKPSKDIEESLECDICGKLFSRKDTKKRHEIMVHKTAGDHLCNICTKAFSSAEELAEHKETCLRTRGRSYVTGKFECDICGTVLKNKHVLRGHMRWKHSPSAKKFKCKLCDASFIQQTLLDIHHNRTHLDIKDQMCSICGRSFKTKEQLKSHTNSHTGERPFKCTFNGCEKSFRSRSNRENHMRTHTGEKRFQCSVEGCGRPFLYVKDLRRHKYQIHKIIVNKHPCTICNEIFPENSFLKKHMLNHNVLL